MTARSVLAVSISTVWIFGAANAAPPTPNLARIAGSPASARGKIYADCIAQSVGAGTYDRTSDGDTHLLRFHCAGAPARAFYDELAAWSTARDSQWSADGRTWRATAKIKRNLFGTDYCSTDGSADYACDVTLNVGDFLDG